MTISIHMPALSPTMEEGTLSKWLVAEGDKVAPGDAIAEIETDKATMEVEAVDEGTVAKFLVPGGTEGVVVGTLIAVLLEEGEDESALQSTIEAAVASAPSPAAAPAPKAAAAALAPVAPAAQPAPQPAPQAVLQAAPAPTPSGNGRIKASPLAKRLATEAGLELAALQGSGPGGRIVRADIEAAKSGAPAAAPAAASAPAPTPSAVPMTSDTPFEEVRLSAMRKTIARRLTEAKQTVPHFYLTMDVEIDRLLELRKRLNAKLEGEAKNGGIKLSVNDFIVRAAALALMRVPDANVQYAGETMRRFSRADISVAVATPGGLITPIVRGADLKGLQQISTEMKDLAARAREGKLAPEEYQGGTFSISNLGMYGVREFAAVINPPQGAILAVGAGEARPIVRHGAVQTATMMTLTLSCDHRAIDGAVGAEFLGVLKGFLEEPGAMLL